MLYRIVVSICILTFVAIGKVDAADFGGDQAVLKILKESTESPYTVMNEESQEPQRLLRKYMRKRKWKDSYTSGKFRIFQIGTYSFPSRNPARDRSFVRKRSIAATMAQLNAKIKIIEGIRTTMSASDQFTMPGSPIQKKLNGKKQDLDNKFDDINDRLVKALEKADKAESARLEGADWNDRAEAFADALIKKLNASYNKKQIEGEKLEKAVEMNKKLEELKRLKKDLLEEADKLRNSVKNQTQSSVSSLAEMPLYGIMVLATEESWEPENGNYEVAVLTVWSQKHEMFTRALLTGQHKLPISGDNGELIDWLDGQKFANMIGGQNFTDSKGIRWIIGTAMSELRGNNKKEAVLTAELLSKKEVAMALFSEIRSEKIYKNASKELVTDALKQTTEMKVEESLEVQNRQSFKDRDVSGVFVIDGKVIRHPFTKKKRNCRKRQN